MAAGINEMLYHKQIAVALSEILQKPDYGSAEIAEEEEDGD